MKKIKPFTIVLSLLIIAGLAVVFVNQSDNAQNTPPAETGGGMADMPETETPMSTENENTNLPNMAIESLRSREYPGGQFTVEQTLAGGSNFSRQIVSYESEGLKVRGLLTVPLTDEPEGGFPAIMFIHGYIPPLQYSTVNSYPTYQSRLARAGFVTFKPDLRGHDESEGEPVSAHHSEKYTVDTLFALSYLKQHKDVNADKIGYWGHSNGGQIGLRTILIDKDVKAASLWAGVVGSYEDMFETYVDEMSFLETDNPLTRIYGLPSENPETWAPIEPYNFLEDINIPIQLQHATGDASVPFELSVSLRDALKAEGKQVEYIEYPGDDHNISGNVNTAFERAINFYRENL